MNRNTVETIGLVILLIFMIVGAMMFRPFSRNQTEVVGLPEAATNIASLSSKKFAFVTQPNDDQPSVAPQETTLKDNSGSATSNAVRPTREPATHLRDAIPRAQSNAGRLVPRATKRTAQVLGPILEASDEVVAKLAL